MSTIKNDETIAPGTQVVTVHRKIGVVYEVLETRKIGKWLEGRLRHTGTGRSVGWRFLDTMQIVDAAQEDTKETK